MPKIFKAKTKVGKSFTYLSALMMLVFSIIFLYFVLDSLAMDKNSYYCTQDSMMMQFCHSPVSSSFAWTIVTFGLIAWPALAVWVILGSVLLLRRIRRVV